MTAVRPAYKPIREGTATSRSVRLDKLPVHSIVVPRGGTEAYLKYDRGPYPWLTIDQEVPRWLSSEQVAFAHDHLLIIRRGPRT